jgi:hypothetical protein
MRSGSLSLSATGRSHIDVSSAFNERTRSRFGYGRLAVVAVKVAFAGLALLALARRGRTRFLDVLFDEILSSRHRSVSAQVRALSVRLDNYSQLLLADQLVSRPDRGAHAEFVLNHAGRPISLWPTPIEQHKPIDLRVEADAGVEIGLDGKPFAETVRPCEGPHDLCSLVLERGWVDGQVAVTAGQVSSGITSAKTSSK